MSFAHKYGNHFLSWLTKLLYRSNLSDMETCYKLFDRRVLDGIRLYAERFEFEPEVTAKVLRSGVKIQEVPISYAGRDFHEGKKITWRDGVSAVWALMKYRFVPFRTTATGAQDIPVRRGHRRCGTPSGMSLAAPDGLRQVGRAADHQESSARVPSTTWPEAARARPPGGQSSSASSAC